MRAHHPITVVNKYHENDGIYIGRGSPLGNPFPVYKGRFRDGACDLYEAWINKQIAENNPSVIKELERLASIAEERPLKLKCFCKPRRCHGDTIKRILEEAFARDEELPTDA